MSGTRQSRPSYRDIAEPIRLRHPECGLFEQGDDVAVLELEGDAGDRVRLWITHLGVASITTPSLPYVVQ